MLYVSLAYSFILLAISILALRGHRWSVVAFVVFGLVYMFAPPLVPRRGNSPAVELQFITLAAGLLVLLMYPRYRSRLAFAFPVAVTAAVYCLGGLKALETRLEGNRLRAALPFESMEERVPEPNSSLRMPPACSAVSAELKELETEGWVTHGNGRARALRELHEKTFDTFVDSPGFGVRRNFYYKPWLLELRHSGPRPQPKPGTASVESVQSVVPDPATVIPCALSKLHRRSIAEFAYPQGFGYIKDRRHVAGFDPHGFVYVPEPVEHWHIETVELVGLLLHPEAVAYVSANLPQMEELRDAPTRPLDEFESAALGRIRQGEQLVLGESGPTLRMVGSVRSLAQCVKCHGGERGDLLGAFSYTLRKSSPNP